MNVFGEVSELIFISNADSFVCILKKMADALVAGVEIANIFGAKRTHEVIDALNRVLVN